MRERGSDLHLQMQVASFYSINRLFLQQEFLLIFNACHAGCGCVLRMTSWPTEAWPEADLWPLIGPRNLQLGLWLAEAGSVVMAVAQWVSLHQSLLASRALHDTNTANCEQESPLVKLLSRRNSNKGINGFNLNWTDDYLVSYYKVKLKRVCLNNWLFTFTRH